MDRGAWQARVHGGAESDTAKHEHKHEREIGNRDTDVENEWVNTWTPRGQR